MNIKELLEKMTPEEKCYLLSGKDFWQTRSVERVGIPNMTLSDGPHGIRKQEGSADQLGLHESVPATCFPTAAAIANSWNPKLGEEVGRALGEEALAQGVNVILGPGLNIKRNPLCGRNFEYFSEDPYLAGKMAAGYVKGIQSMGVAACPKHFAANSQELRRMASDSVMDERTFRELYLTGFEIAVKEAKPMAMMSSYNKINGTYANENYHLLQEILREQWGFEGFVVSDWGGSNNHVEGTGAGANLEMPTTKGDSDEELLQAVRAGALSQEVVDQRAEELLRIVFATTEAAKMKKQNSFDIEAHHEAAQKAAEESIVLLKNEENILPLKGGTKTAVIGDFAENPRYQGAGSSIVNPTRLDNAAEMIKQTGLDCVGYAKGYHRTGEADETLEREAAALAKKAEVVLVYIGLDEIAETEGLDRSHMRIPESHIRLLGKIATVNPNVVAVIAAGAAIETPWIEECKAVVHGALCGQAGALAVLKVITGEVNPSGKLSESYPMKYEDTPNREYFPAEGTVAEYREGLYVGYRYYDKTEKAVRFPFGFGLSYTTFAYGDLEVNEQGVSLKVTNTGAIDGAEVVQLYVGKQESALYRPKKELKGFTKVWLKAGESKKVLIPFDDKTFRYFDTKTGTYEIEPGDYEIMAGAGSRDIRLRNRISIKGTRVPESEDLSKLPSYVSGEITKVTEEEFETLLGRKIPQREAGEKLDVNDALSRLPEAKNVIAKLIGRIMAGMLQKSIRSGKPDLNLLFVCNMPFRAIGKMTGGIVSQEMVNGMVTMVNGRFCKGLGRVIGGFFRQRGRAEKANEMK